VLFRAVELAFAAEKAFKPALGSFTTYVGHRLKELHRLHDQEENATSSPVHYSKGELEQDEAEERGEEVELEFSGGNGPRLTFDFQWWLAKLASNVISSLMPFSIDKSEIRTFKSRESGSEKERTNYSRLHTIPRLDSRHRLAAGV